MTFADGNPRILQRLPLVRALALAGEYEGPWHNNLGRSE